jgi:hypothetical protein
VEVSAVNVRDAAEIERAVAAFARSSKLLRAHGERPRRRTADRVYQFPPSDDHWHVPPPRGLPCEGTISHGEQSAREDV